MLQPLLLTPSTRSAIWGGNRLRALGKTLDGPNIAESWELSCHKNGMATVANGPLAGKTLPEALAILGDEALGTEACGMPFPLLIKLLDADSDLSIQVHPADEYAMRVENELGKTEMWVILHAEPGAKLLCGFSQIVSREEIEQRIADNTLTEVLQSVPVQPGDAVLIPAGTVHAIGGGITLAEIQQSSDATYRLYDYGRRDANGNLRELHVAKALDVLLVEPPLPVINPAADETGTAVLADCDSFRVERWTSKSRTIQPNAASFCALLCVDGEAVLRCGEETIAMPNGSCVFVPANCPTCMLEGDCTILATTAKRKDV